MLFPDEGRILTRLRLSGVELNGTAVLDGTQLRLTFPDREEITGTFVSRTELDLRLDASGLVFRLEKRG